MRCMNRLTPVVIALTFLVGIGCSKDSARESSFPDSTLPGDFTEFYVKFHEDTAYQIDHISFPLQGIRAFSSIDSNVQNKPWAREEWVYHSRIDPDAGYEVTFDLLTDELITETIVDTSETYAMQRRFAMTSDGWQLIYYVEMQPATLSTN